MKRTQIWKKKGTMKKRAPSIYRKRTNGVVGGLALQSKRARLQTHLFRQGEKLKVRPIIRTERRRRLKSGNIRWGLRDRTGGRHHRARNSKGLGRNSLLHAVEGGVLTAFTRAVEGCPLRGEPTSKTVLGKSERRVGRKTMN